MVCFADFEEFVMRNPSGGSLYKGKLSIISGTFVGGTKKSFFNVLHSFDVPIKNSELESSIIKESNCR